MTISTPDILETTVSVNRPHTAGRPLQAFPAIPSGPGPYPGVVIIHEILGLNDNIRGIGRRFVQEGYAALAVDLFSTASQVIYMARVFHGMLLRPLENGIVGDLQAALDCFGARPEVDYARLGAIGFCMGGSYALQLACVDGDLRGEAPEAAAEAQYWAGVSKYKGTNDATALKETAQAFKQRYQDTSWAKKASVWG